jgi:hypothetical protein
MSMKNFATMTAFASVLAASNEASYSNKPRIDRSKTVLTNKQKKARNKSKSARKARKNR